MPILSFVGFYSLLPHKEWRFVVYVVPGLTAIAAAGASWIWTRRAKSAIYALLSLALLASVLLSFVASSAFLAISSLNYPGGGAIDFLHNGLQHPPGVHLQVYFDNLACQTGVTRFLENHDEAQTMMDVLESQDIAHKRIWTYSKAEDPELLLEPAFWHGFDYVIAERPERVIGSWEEVYVVYSFKGIRLYEPGDATSPSSRGTVSKRDIITRIAHAWKSLEKLVRYRILRGWWAEVLMEPRIRIFEKSDEGFVCVVEPSSTNTNDMIMERCVFM